MSRKKNKDRECVETGECRPPHAGSKDTRHYCKGKVGVEHQWRWMRCVDIPNDSFHGRRRSESIIRERLVCVVCMKLDYRARDRCAHCLMILGTDDPPGWMKVPPETHGAITITREVLS